MASSVHFKFKSQKEFSRVSFDGTGISVFELKREVISQSKLGDGNDFDLAIYNAETGEAYDDDTALVPRTTRIIVRRLPAARPGKGGAARYVSGRMPVNAKSNAKIESPAPSGATAAAPAQQDLGAAQSEEDKIKALLSLQESQWKVQQEEMANVTPVLMGRGRGKPTNVPDHPPPPGYLCYRCREKGHWIQACPTNNDPNFDGHYRVKRSTGIPRSLQKQVERPDGVDSLTEDSKVSGVMVNADGDFVIAQPDKASWELYQEKAKAAAAAASEAAAVESSKEIEARGLQCPTDKRMFLEPTKTPCCGKTYCNDCITNALIESDFTCPACGAEEVLLDDLTPDTDMAEKIKSYEAEREELKEKAQKRGEEMENQQVSYTTDPLTPVSHSPTADSSSAAVTTTTTNEVSPEKSTETSAPSTAAKKRPSAGDEEHDNKVAQSPPASKKVKRSESPHETKSAEQTQAPERSPSSARARSLTAAHDAAAQGTASDATDVQNTAAPAAAVVAPAAGTPTTQNPTAQTAAAQTLAAQTPATQSSTAQTAAAQAPVAQTPVTQTSTAQTTGAQASAAQTTTAPLTSTPTVMPQMPAQSLQISSAYTPMPYMQQGYATPYASMGFQGAMPGMPFPGGPMSMPGFMPGMEASDGMWNMQNMQNMAYGARAGPFPNMQYQNAMMGGGFMPGFDPSNPMGAGYMNQQQQQQNMYYAQNQMGSFANQQRNAYCVTSKEEEQPYLRQPVNPHRHQGRQKRLRPTDFREL